MQLKNRLVKADFWTDTGLIRKLPAMGRMMYQGLWQLAEDSGVIEADPLAYKMLLFPLDDISIDDIEEWTNALVELGKLISFGEGEYYYIKNFHRHQSLRSPAKPNLPLPNWVVYVPNNKKRQSGGYIIDYKAMPNYSEHTNIETIGNVSDTVLNRYIDDEESEGNSQDNRKEELENSKGDRTVSDGQTTDTNKNLKENKNLNKKEKENKDHDEEDNAHTCEEESLSNKKKDPVFDMYEKVFGRCLSPYQVELLDSYSEDGLSTDIVVMAIEEGGKRDASGFKWLQTTLNDWLSKELDEPWKIKKYLNERDGPKRGDGVNGKHSSNNSRGLNEGSQHKSEYGEGCLEAPELQEIDVSIDEL
ncbi:DnaD domain protein [Orenia marismortui]|uniref:DnaD/phage-associated family protein n=1 Tax=Orenia marismortui TaxID=46469 RepID=A0A4R8GYU6_9FIRM|nr:DnaD domain protein [Orenia marismortui]TDX49127.1 DnaD/phage-associated family protein [Orenia marismortui]